MWVVGDGREVVGVEKKNRSVDCKWGVECFNCLFVFICGL